MGGGGWWWWSWWQWWWLWWCVVCGVWCVVCGVWCVVCGVWCVVDGCGGGVNAEYFFFFFFFFYVFHRVLSMHVGVKPARLCWPISGMNSATVLGVAVHTASAAGLACPLS